MASQNLTTPTSVIPTIIIPTFVIPAKAGIHASLMGTQASATLGYAVRHYPLGYDQKQLAWMAACTAMTVVRAADSVDKTDSIRHSREGGNLSKLNSSLHCCRMYDTPVAPASNCLQLLRRPNSDA